MHDFRAYILPMFPSPPQRGLSAIAELLVLIATGRFMRVIYSLWHGIVGIRCFFVIVPDMIIFSTVREY